MFKSNPTSLKKRILLIDDDKDDAEFFEDALKDVDHTVIFEYIHDGREAIRKIMQQELEIPDIIFLDINMPFITGWDCLAAIKQQALLQQVSVIMYSTSNHTTEVSKAADMGADDYWIKPHSIKDLRNQLAGLLNSQGQK